MRISATFFALFIGICNLSAQLDSTATYKVKSDSIEKVRIDKILSGADIERFLPPLPLLIDSAIANSPEVQQAEAFVKIREFETAQARKEFWNTIILGAQMNYGSFGNLLVDEISIGQQVQVTVRMPLSTWIGRSDRIGEKEGYIESEKARREAASRQVQENVIAAYNNLLLIRRQLEIVGDAKETGVLVKEMAELKFTEGELSVDQLGITTDFWMRQGTQYESLKAQFSNTYYALERMAGVPFSKFEKY
jgi:outer membrane protein TolC